MAKEKKVRDYEKLISSLNEGKVKKDFEEQKSIIHQQEKIVAEMLEDPDLAPFILDEEVDVKSTYSGDHHHHREGNEYLPSTPPNPNTDIAKAYSAVKNNIPSAVITYDQELHDNKEYLRISINHKDRDKLNSLLEGISSTGDMEWNHDDIGIFYGKICNWDVAHEAEILREKNIEEEKDVKEPKELTYYEDKVSSLVRYRQKEQKKVWDFYTGNGNEQESNEALTKYKGVSRGVKKQLKNIVQEMEKDPYIAPFLLDRELSVKSLFDDDYDRNEIHTAPPNLSSEIGIVYSAINRTLPNAVMDYSTSSHEENLDIKCNQKDLEKLTDILEFMTEKSDYMEWRDTGLELDLDNPCNWRGAFRAELERNSNTLDFVDTLDAFQDLTLEDNVLGYKITDRDGNSQPYHMYLASMSSPDEDWRVTNTHHDDPEAQAWAAEYMDAEGFITNELTGDKNVAIDRIKELKNYIALKNGEPFGQEEDLLNEKDISVTLRNVLTVYIPLENQEEDSRILGDTAKQVMNEVLLEYPLTAKIYETDSTVDVAPKNLDGFYANELTISYEVSEEEGMQDLLSKLKNEYNDLSWHNQEEIQEEKLDMLANEERSIKV